MVSRIILWAMIFLYFLPAAVASYRRLPRKDHIIAVNTLLGWTVIGWLIALVEALRGSFQRPVSSKTVLKAAFAIAVSLVFITLILLWLTHPSMRD